MASRRMITVGTLAVTAVVVGVMAIVGYHSLTAPFPSRNAPVAASTPDAPSCAAGQRATIVKVLRRSAVTVSVYNAGKKSGRARSTLDRLESAGFSPGAIGNAPAGSVVAKAEVHATTADATKAELVALAFGKGTLVVVDNNQLGPGIDVFIGDKFKRLDPKAVRSIKLPTPQVHCS